MLAFRTETPTTCGILKGGQAWRGRRFPRKSDNPPGNLANGAVYLLCSEFLAEMRLNFGGATDFSTEVLPHFVGRIQAYETSRRCSLISAHLRAMRKHRNWRAPRTLVSVPSRSMGEHIARFQVVEFLIDLFEPIAPRQ